MRESTKRWTRGISHRENHRNLSGWQHQAPSELEKCSCDTKPYKVRGPRSTAYASQPALDGVRCSSHGLGFRVCGFRVLGFRV